MKLSVIIISYNVRYFLEQCLCSVQKAVHSYQSAAQSTEIEVLVVDNRSLDDSLAYLQPRFPFVQFIANPANTGFAKANNLALQQASGQYILFLNPDTIVPENCFADCIAFMEQRADAGALGVHMIDGSGRFLQESKRGFPSPWVSFCKMTGLTSAFPKSRMFAGYYLGHLSQTGNQVVDALSGAFMLVRKTVLDKTGGFDEQFFMYAEDIDLSYRIQQAGYRNYYFADCTIIHFKGESTSKDSRYVQLFYKAMIQFVQKHYTGKTSALYIKLLEAAIRLRATAAAFSLHKKSNAPTTPLVKECTALQKIDRPVNTALNDASSTPLLFCEGKQLSFEQIIALLQQLTASRKMFIQGHGTTSAVSSGDKNSRGEVIVTRTK